MKMCIRDRDIYLHIIYMDKNYNSSESSASTHICNCLLYTSGFLKRQEANGKFFSKAMQKETNTDMEEV